MPLHCWSSAHYTFPLPPGHRFPIEKYALIRDRLVRERVIPADHVHDPARATLGDVLAIHTPAYVDAILRGTLSREHERRIGVPWSPQLAERSLRAVGGTCEAAAYALDHGLAMNLAGGTHHAFPDRGEGFCVFNDTAITYAKLRRDGRIRRAAVIDLDVHQGNGTHAIFAGTPDVYTFSVHGRKNYPFHKVPGTLDVELDDGAGDDEYLTTLAAHLPGVLAAARPDLVFYLAGSDPHEGDRLGRMCLTFDGLMRRDAMVLNTCREVGFPVVITVAGGYGRDIQTTVDVHVNTVRVANRYI